MEQKLLSALCQRVHYDTLVATIKPREELSPSGALVFEEISNFFKLDPAAKVCDLDILAERVIRRVDGEKHRNLLRDFVGGLAADVSGINVLAEWRRQKSDAAKARLLQVLAAPTEVPAQIKAALENYQASFGDASLEEATQAYSVHNAVPVAQLQEATGVGNRLPLLPTALNGKIAGGLLPGHTALVFARPEVGKTAFALNAARGAARAGKRVLYLGNEDPVLEAIIPRAWCCFSGMPWNRAGKQMEEEGKKSGIDNVTFVAMWPGTPEQVAELIAKYQPALTIVDQVGNLSLKEDNYTQQLGRLMRALRAIAKRSGTVMLCMHQAGDSAQDKLVLELGDVSWSNTDMAAQADLMVGIGCNPNYMAQNLRMLSVCKNKLSGWHGHFPVTADTDTSRYRSLDNHDV